MVGWLVGWLDGSGLVEVKNAFTGIEVTLHWVDNLFKVIKKAMNKMKILMICM